MKLTKKEPPIEDETMEWLKWYMKKNKCGLKDAADERYKQLNHGKN